MIKTKTAYEKASPVIHDLVKKVMADHHTDLLDCDVEIAILVVRKISEDGEAFHALKHHGAEAAAKISLVPARRRLLVDHDLELVVDGLTWDNIPAPSREALLDHELTHVVVQKDKNGQPKTDDIGRPRLKLRPDDYAINGFFEVAERHGNFAMEAVTLRRIHERMLVALGTAAKSSATDLISALKEAGAALTVKMAAEVAA